jgi:putative two-component system response regulator
LLVSNDSPEFESLRVVLRKAGYSNIQCAKGLIEGCEALETFRASLIILSAEESGKISFAALCEKANNHLVPILAIDKIHSPLTKERALEAGVCDFLSIPFEEVEVCQRIRNCLGIAELRSELQSAISNMDARVKQRTEALAIARAEAIELLAKVCEYRDDESGEHAMRVGELSAHIAAEMGLEGEFVEAIRLAATLHDIGKVAIPDSLLIKAERLSEEEGALMKRHAGIGARLMGETNSSILQLAKEIALFHHEQWDGNGYESGIAGEAIPLSARIVTVADAFDVITHDRPFRQGRSPVEALEEIDVLAGSQFDPSVVKALQAHFAKFLGRAA